MQKDSKSRTVFVSGLSYSTNEEELKNFFSTCGNIELVKLPKYKGTERNIGYAHITFDDSETRMNALNLNGKFLNGRYLDIQPARGPQNLPKIVEIEDIKEDGIFIKNLPYKCSQTQIAEFFESCGKIKNLEMISPSSKFLGYCYICFEDTSAIQKALLLSGHPMHDRFLKIDLMSFETFQKVKEDILSKRDAKRVLKIKKAKIDGKRVSNDPKVQKHYMSKNMKSDSNSSVPSHNSYLLEQKESENYGKGLTTEMQFNNNCFVQNQPINPVTNQNFKHEELMGFNYELNPPPGLPPMQNPMYQQIQHLAQNPQMFQQYNGLSYYSTRSISHEKSQPQNTNKVSNNFCQGSRFLGDNRYNNKKTPVQSAIEFLKSNGHGYSDNNNYQSRDSQNGAYYRQPEQDFSQYDGYEMQMQANAQNYAKAQAQMHNQNSNFSHDYGFHQASGENCAPNQMSTNNQYFGNYNMPNQHGSYQYFQNNSLVNQSINLSRPNFEYNAPKDYSYEKERTNNSYEIQRNSPEFSPVRSNDTSNDNFPVGVSNDN